MNEQAQPVRFNYIKIPDNDVVLVTPNEVVVPKKSKDETIDDWL